MVSPTFDSLAGRVVVSGRISVSKPGFCERDACLGKPVHKRSQCPRKPPQKAKKVKGGSVRKPPHGQARCGACSGLVRVVMSDGVPAGFERHKYPSSNQWCPNGTQPVKRVKAKGSHKGKSVRAVGGGLPTLGRR